MRYEGKVYRPWTEANSILLQVTYGCSNNNCTFCTMFSDKKFKVRPIDEVFEDIEGLAKYYPDAESMFLVDGNAMVLKTSHLLKIVEKIKATFPHLQNLALYSELNDLRRKSVEELTQLREAGVTMVYSGLESGDPVVLEKIKKSMTVEQAIEGMEKAKASGIRVLLSFIFGLGGTERSRVHIEETTKLLNILQPEEIAPMALAIQPGSVLGDELRAGEFTQATPRQILEEEKHLLENMGDFECYYWGDHGNNMAPQRGMMPYNRENFLKKVNLAFTTHPAIDNEVLHTFAW